MQYQTTSQYLSIFRCGITFLPSSFGLLICVPQHANFPAQIRIPNKRFLLQPTAQDLFISTPHVVGASPFETWNSKLNFPSVENVSVLQLKKVRLEARKDLDKFPQNKMKENLFKWRRHPTMTDNVLQNNSPECLRKFHSVADTRNPFLTNLHE